VRGVEGKGDEAASSGLSRRAVILVENLRVDSIAAAIVELVEIVFL
jgi:hypothetical protein